jgi:hypothetical protein
MGNAMDSNTKSAILFVYNANSGLFNALADVAHKVLSPQTYPCNLCAITNSALGMRKEWKTFLEGLGIDKEFLHRDQLAREYRMENVELPAVFRKRGKALDLLVDAEAINRCESIEDLKRVLTERMSEPA